MSPSGDLTKHNIEDDCDDDLDEHHDDSSDKYLKIYQIAHLKMKMKTKTLEKLTN